MDGLVVINWYAVINIMLLILHSLLSLIIIIWEEHNFLTTVWPGQIRSALNEMGLGELFGSLNWFPVPSHSICFVHSPLPISELISNTAKSGAEFAWCTRTPAALIVSNDCTVDQWCSWERTTEIAQSRFKCVEINERWGLRDIDEELSVISVLVLIRPW